MNIKNMFCIININVMDNEKKACLIYEQIKCLQKMCITSKLYKYRWRGSYCN